MEHCPNDPGMPRDDELMGDRLGLFLTSPEGAEQRETLATDLYNALVDAQDEQDATTSATDPSSPRPAS